MTRPAGVNRWALAFAAYFSGLLTVIALAYLGRLDLDGPPFSDTLGHFILFGLAAYLADRALRRRHVFLLDRARPLGPLLIGLFAIGEEFLQLLSPNRSFDLVDLGASLCGVVFLWLLDRSLSSGRAGADPRTV